MRDISMYPTMIRTLEYIISCIPELIIPITMIRFIRVICAAG